MLRAQLGDDVESMLARATPWAELAIDPPT